MGWTIVSHSFVLLFRNLGYALKVSVGPYLIGIAIAMAGLILAGIPWAVFAGGFSPQGSMMVAENAGGLAFVVMLFIFVVILFVSSWVAVSWHRFVLLEEYPGLLPALSGRPVWPYLGRVIILAMLMVLISIPLGLGIGLISAPFVMNSGVGTTGELTGTFAVVSLLLGIAFAAILSWLWLRWGLTLPAIAVGKPMGLRESWAATKPMSGAILAASLILFAISIAITFVIDRIFGVSVIAIVLGLIVNWINIMVGISMLTTLYGNLVEGRAIG